VTPTATPTTTPTPGVGTSNIRFINPWGDVQNLVVTIDGTPVAGDLDGPDTSPYTEVSAGSHVLRGTISGTEVFSENVTTTDGQFRSLVVVPSASARTGIPAQSAGDIDTLFLTDDVTPNAGALNARLIHANIVNNRVQGENDDSVILAGPVNAGEAGPYVNVPLAEIQGNEFVRAQYLDPQGADAFSFIFFDTVGSSTLADALAAAVGTQGANLTFIVSEDADDDQILYIIVDEGAQGDQTILSEAGFL
jgi:hypothetical protein